MTKPPMVQSVTRAIRLLQALEQGPRSLSRLVDDTGLSKATAHRLLASLSFGQLVIQDPVSGEYLLGPGCFGIGDAVIRGYGGLNVLSTPVLERLRQETGETVALHLRIGVQRVCVAQLPSPQAVRYVARLGAAQPLYLGAMGKVILAFSDGDVQREILDRTTLKQVTERTVTDRAALERQLVEIRLAGFAISRGENVAGAASISVPVVGTDSVIASLSIIGPEARMGDARMEELLPLLREGAEEIRRLVARNEVPVETGQSLVEGDD